MSEDETTLSNTLKEIAEDKGWDDTRFLEAILDALDLCDGVLSLEANHKLIDTLDGTDTP